MPCYKPLEGWFSKERTKTGKRKVVFRLQDAYHDMPVTVPCGQCIGCRLEKSRQWAMRITHEASLHDKNCFLTLTYDDDNLPYHSGLEIEDFQKFMKRLRRKIGKDRYYHCGEYGEQYKRPHYHAILFGYDFPDKELWKQQGDNNLYTSSELSERWGMGHCSIGNVTFDSAAYVARYITKKIYGEEADLHYTRWNPETGEGYDVRPEYTTMSKGIGREWYEKYKDEIHNLDTVVINGKKMQPPKYYDNLFQEDAPDKFRKVKGQRVQNLEKFSSELTRERLQIKHKIKQIKAKELKRNLE